LKLAPQVTFSRGVYMNDVLAGITTVVFHVTAVSCHITTDLFVVTT